MKGKKMRRWGLVVTLLLMMALGSSDARASDMNLSGTLNSTYIRDGVIEIQNADVSTSGEIECFAGTIEIGAPFLASAGSEFKAKSFSNLPEVDPDYLPLVCHADNEQPLFKRVEANDYLEVYLSADFDAINDRSIPLEEKDTAMSMGSIEYNDPSTGNLVQINNIKVIARGKSRYEECGFRPFKIDFQGNQAGTIFSNGSDKIKVVTHCGYLEDQWPLIAGTPEEQRRRLFQEFYIYQVLQTVHSTSLLTRLALITYHNAADGTEFTEWAFFREWEDVAADRCGMVEMEREQFDLYPADPVSHFQGRLQNQFVANLDNGLIKTEAGDLQYLDVNTIALLSEEENAFFIPYDYDMTCVIQPEYETDCFDGMCRSCPTLPENAQLMRDIFEEEALSRSAAQAVSMYIREEEMMEIANKTLFDEDGKLRLLAWLDYNYDEIRDYLF